MDENIQESGKFQNIALSKVSQQGYALLKEHKYDQALEVFRIMLERSPDNNYALVGIGDALRKKQRYQEALPYYQHCLDHSPTNNFALFGIADIMRNSKQYEAAILHWKKYLLYDKNNVAVITRIADSYRRLDNIDESERYYQKALGIQPDNCYAFIGLGWLYFGTKDFRNALQMWLKAIDCPRDRDDIRVYTAIGNCYYKLGEYDQAIGYYQTGEQKNARDFFVLFGLANCYRGKGEYGKSIDYFNRILEHDSENKMVLSRLGDAYAKIEDYQRAKESYKQAIAIRDDIFAAFGLARIAYMEGKHEEAITQLIELLQHRQLSIRVHKQLEEYAQDSNLSARVKKRIIAVL